MNLQNLTLDEMERIAYIEGRTAEAALLGELIAAQSDLSTLDGGHEVAIQDLEEEIDELTDKLSALEDQLDECGCD